MFDSRTDATRNIRANVPTSQHMRRFNDTWMVKGVEVVHPAKPVLTKEQAIAEGLDDLRDVQDMAAIAADGITGLPPFPVRMTCTYTYQEWSCCHECECACDSYYSGYAAERLIEAMFPSLLGDLDADLRPRVPGAIATSETPVTAKVVAAKMDLTEMAKRKRRASIEAQMAKGVQFPDLDPYTLEPYRRNMGGKVVSMVRPSRVRYF